jgi:hypothetical protein
MNACPNDPAGSAAGANRRSYITALIRRVACAFYIRHARRALQSLDDDHVKGYRSYPVRRVARHQPGPPLQTSPPPSTAGQTQGEIVSATTLTPRRRWRAAFNYLPETVRDGYAHLGCRSSIPLES